METVFDHNITPEEWNVIFGINKELYLKIVDEDSAFYHLACLYHLRGAKKDVIQDYLNRIPPTMALDFWRTVTHP